MRRKKRGKIYGWSPRLRPREIISIFHGGMSDLGWEVVKDKVDSGLVNPSVDASEPAARPRAGDATTAVVRVEIDETANALPGLKADLERKKPRMLATGQALKRARANVPAVGLSSKFWLAFGVCLCVGEFGNSAWALADALGIDVTGQVADVSPVSIAIVVTTSLVVTIANGVAGGLALGGQSPLRRHAGWILLFFIAFVLSGIRFAIAGNASIWLMLLSFGISLLSGLAAGYAHRTLSAVLTCRRAYRARVQAAQEDAAAAAAEVAKAESAVAAANARRRTLAAEADTLAAAPEREQTATEDIAALREARRKQAKYWFELGRRFAGRDNAPTGEEGKDA